MKTLMSSSFFDLMTSRDGKYPENDVALVTAYKEFKAIVEHIFYEEEKSSAFFMLANAHIELLQVQKDGKNSDTKKKCTIPKLSEQGCIDTEMHPGLAA
ncbi:hypothetical protein FACS1894177_00670 [Bacteroidia bacterium]|nr:hypothetical protein AGMMS49574_15330 [Bacteroidia bacterium]GHU58747.1 hypothetical protein FACS189411_14650 [Bacteroidia bacterium]GHU66969.1 hypothetical protein FACS189413_00890 [Bacteroidia bacterium]GHV29569.1 hypothetical protein FACS1894177_00670 [Bacteroidia bacterium]